MSSEEYWIGEGINYNKLWEDYFSMKDGYIRKFATSDYYLMQIKFDYPRFDLPLVNHEVIYKTLKGFYHDLKKHTLSKEEYNNYGPLFLYSLERGSNVFEILGQFWPLLGLVVLLFPDIREEVINFIRAHVQSKEIDNANKYFDLVDRAPISKEIKNKLKSEALSSIKMSPEIFKGNIEQSRTNLIEFVEKKVKRKSK